MGSLGSSMVPARLLGISECFCVELMYVIFFNLRIVVPRLTAH